MPSVSHNASLIMPSPLSVSPPTPGASSDPTNRAMWAVSDRCMSNAAKRYCAASWYRCRFTFEMARLYRART